MLPREIVCFLMVGCYALAGHVSTGTNSMKCLDARESLVTADNVRHFRQPVGLKHWSNLFPCVPESSGPPSPLIMCVCVCVCEPSGFVSVGGPGITPHWEGISSPSSAKAPQRHTNTRTGTHGHTHIQIHSEVISSPSPAKALAKQPNIHGGVTPKQFQGAGNIQLTLGCVIRPIVQCVIITQLQTERGSRWALTSGLRGHSAPQTTTTALDTQTANKH